MLFCGRFPILFDFDQSRHLKRYPQSPIWVKTKMPGLIFALKYLRHPFSFALINFKTFRWLMNKYVALYILHANLNHSTLIYLKIVIVFTINSKLSNLQTISTVTFLIIDLYLHLFFLSFISRLVLLRFHNSHNICVFSGLV